ncbi:MAG TPA: hypothetical protein VF659_09460 [Pyrinomonadaceae bacterium]|jgi:hypothetical protein
MQLPSVEQEKVNAARRLSGLQVGELVAVYWPAPMGTVFYGRMQYDELPEYEGLTLPDGGRIEARFAEPQFQPFQISSSVADSQITLQFVDDDGEIARLCELHGEGVRVELWHYYPDVDLLIKRGWFGHLGAPAEVGGSVTPVPASFGFRSPQLSLPSRPSGAGCTFMFGGTIFDPAVLARNGCRYDRQLDGVHGLLDGDGNPFTSCPHTREGCQARIGDTLEYGGGDTATDTITVGQTQGPARQATSRGNESQLTQTIPVHAGEWTARNLQVLAYLVEPNTRHPEQGSAHVLLQVGEGPDEGLSLVQVNDAYIQPMHLNVRRGEYRQPASFFSAHVSNYSLRAHVNAVVQGDFRNATAQSFRGSVKVRGFREVHVYTSPTTFTLQYSVSPAFWILELLTNLQFGDARDVERYVIQDWIDADAWQAQPAGFLDASGVQYSSTRATFSAEILERTTQQIIKDACRDSFLSLPFPYGGYERIVPLRKEDLTDVPTFTDDLDLIAADPNVRPILFDGAGSTLRTKKVRPEGELTNYLTVNFFDAAHDHIKRPLVFQDERAQQAAAAAGGDKSVRRIRDEVTLFGVTDFGQAVRCGNRILDLGEFDSGGLKNNREANFQASWLETIDLHPHRVIKVISWKLLSLREKFDGQDGRPTLYYDDDGRPYLYWRVQTLDNETDLTVGVRGVLYRPDYYEHLEDVEQAPERPAPGLDPNPGGPGDGLPEPIGFAEVSTTFDRIHFRLAESTF